MLKPFYLFLMMIWGALVVYTGKVVLDHGWNLFPQFIGDLTRWSWAGQFNFDFTVMLFLAAAWTAWRNGFSATGVALAVVAFFGGAGFLLPYLTYLAWKHEGDTAAVLIGTKFKDRVA